MLNTTRFRVFGKLFCFGKCLLEGEKKYLKNAEWISSSLSHIFWKLYIWKQVFFKKNIKEKGAGYIQTVRTKDYLQVICGSDGDREEIGRNSVGCRGSDSGQDFDDDHNLDNRTVAYID